MQRFGVLYNDYLNACRVFHEEDRRCRGCPTPEIKQIMLLLLKKIEEWYPIICQEYDETRGVEHNPAGNYHCPFNAHAEVLARAYWLKVIACPINARSL